MKIEENKTKRWFGNYKGVDFEINCWVQDYDNSEHWTYYLIIKLDRIPEEHNPKSFWLRGKKSEFNFIYYDYYNHKILNNIYWHGGITWYSKQRGFDGEKKVIKVGCDFSHHWDDGKFYNLEIIKSEVIKTIEDFREKVPGYKYCCCGDGNLYNLEDGIIKNGRFYSKQYYGDKPIWQKLTN